MKNCKEQMMNDKRDYKIILYNYLNDVPETWEERFDNVQNFIKTNDRMPSQSSKNKEERALAKWISKFKTKFKKGELTQEMETKISLSKPTIIMHQAKKE